jgi:Transglycosylase SLT domain
MPARVAVFHGVTNGAEQTPDAPGASAADGASGNHPRESRSPGFVGITAETAGSAAIDAVQSGRILRCVFVLLALVLAMAPCLVTAKDLPGSGANTPLRPPSRNYAAELQSPGGRLAHGQVGPTVVYSAALSGALRPGLPFAAGAVCRAALAAAETRHAIPAGLLQAIGIVESGRPNEATGTRQPWPWTINVEGESRYFDTKAQAVTWVREAQARGTRSIDTGCAQVNLMHHPAAFASLEQAFDPAANADYAARFLKALWTAASGNWLTAVGYYHSQTPELAEAYRRQVQAVTSRSAGPAPFLLTLTSSLDRNAVFGLAGRSTGLSRQKPDRRYPYLAQEP